MAEQLQTPQFVPLENMVPGRHGDNVYLKIVEANKVSQKVHNGQEFIEITGKAGTPYGVIDYIVRGLSASKIDNIEVGKVYAFRNVKSAIFNREFHRIQVDKFGKITPAPEITIGDVNLQNNLSAIQYEKVMRPSHPRFPGGNGPYNGPNHTHYNNHNNHFRGGDNRPRSQGGYNNYNNQGGNRPYNKDGRPGYPPRQTHGAQRYDNFPNHNRGIDGGYRGGEGPYRGNNNNNNNNQNNQGFRGGNNPRNYNNDGGYNRGGNYPRGANDGNYRGNNQRQ